MRSTAARRLRPGHLLVVPVLGAVLALTGCSAGADGASDKDAAAAADAGNGGGSDAKASAPSGRTDAKEPSKSVGTHIVRTARLSVRVKDVPRALADARSAAEEAGGIVGSETTDRDGHGRERTRVTLRVPQDAYEEVLERLSGGGRLLERTVTAQDVTDQVVDVDSRVRSQRASVARVRELMDRATKLSDVVTLEGELSRRQAELESLLARQASLKDRTTLATITLRLTAAPAPGTDDADAGPGLGDALAGGWHAFVAVLRWIVVVLAAVLPFAAVLAAGVLGWLRVLRPRLRGPVPAAEAGGGADGDDGSAGGGGTAGRG
ncbi:DUF4349 domain-containing protein [Streptomyces sp. SID5785]|uniref:DUF4349 domain-containing protein n=1 Tax=Streptomyces sp. SID5785 TaxID=2690309 RepID=UPI001360D62D|nr:DUF4349 domain-containing protein [Streptomyces sp. SID5785]MZD05908.1 DUF4349 domain-containing protein [Streptomyces sp. SID5785]